MNDSAYTIYLEPANKKRKGKFKKGNVPWNKGLSWEEQGIVGEEAKRRKEAFQKASHKNGYSHKPTHSKPVIQMDMDWNRLHWYISSNEAARKLGLHGRNIRKVCDGERNHTGGFRFKWDERFLT